MKAIKGLYAVTPDEQDTRRLVDQVGAALDGGATIVQYRNKLAGPKERLEQAMALARVCRRHHATFIVNDHLDVAIEVDADGLHVGRDDALVEVVRARLGSGKILGVSCYGDITRAVLAREAKADYVAFGGFFPSSTKPGISASPLGVIAAAKKATGLPVVAIGGITPDNAHRLVAAGVDAVAVISGLFGADDIRATAAAFVALFNRGST